MWFLWVVGILIVIAIMVELWFIVIPILGVLVFFLVKQYNNKKQKAIKSFDSRPIGKEVVQFFNACKDFSDLPRFGVVKVEPGNIISAELTVIEAVKKSCSLGDCFDADCFQTFINPPNAHALVDSIDEDKLSAVFGRGTYAKPCSYDEGSIIIYTMWHVPKDVHPAFYIDRINQKLSPHFTVKVENDQQKSLRIKIQ